MSDGLYEFAKRLATGPDGLLLAVALLVGVAGVLAYSVVSLLSAAG